MKHLNLLFLAILCLSIDLLAAGQTTYNVKSPDGKLSATIELKDKIYYSLTYDNKQVITASPISMTLNDGTVLGKDPVARKNSKKTVTQPHICRPHTGSGLSLGPYYGIL